MKNLFKNLLLRPDFYNDKNHYTYFKQSDLEKANVDEWMVLLNTSPIKEHHLLSFKVNDSSLCHADYPPIVFLKHSFHSLMEFPEAALKKIFTNLVIHAKRFKEEPESWLFLNSFSNPNPLVVLKNIECIKTNLNIQLETEENLLMIVSFQLRHYLYQFNPKAVKIILADIFQPKNETSLVLLQTILKSSYSKKHTVEFINKFQIAQEKNQLSHQIKSQLPSKIKIL